MAYKECRIQACAGGSGEYQTGEFSGAVFDHEGDLIDAMRNSTAPADLYELGVDQLPDAIEDIRGHL